MKYLLITLAIYLCSVIYANEGSNKPSTAQANVSVFSMYMPQLNRERTIRIYLPPNYHKTEKYYPVIYMHDGQNLFDDATSYVGEWGVDESLNALYEKTGFEIIVVGIDHGGSFRINELKPFDDPEYGIGEGRKYIDFIVLTLMPYVEKHYRISRNKQDTAMIGSSLGGLITLFAAHRYPERFGKLGIFSPAYWIAGELKNKINKSPLSRDIKVYSIIGEKEGDPMIEYFNEFNKDIMSQLDEFHTQITPDAGHNEQYWKRQFLPAVKWLYSEAIR